MRKQSGISLVALIITIIVMTILAGIVIVSAVSDGGIIDKAEMARQNHEVAEIKEIIMESYEFKTIASEKTYGNLDLERTAEKTYTNLTKNKYKLIAEDGSEFNSKEEFVESQRNEENEIVIIKLRVEGKYGVYGGFIDKEGLKDGEIIIEESNGSTSTQNPTPNPTPGSTPSDGQSGQASDLQKLKLYFENQYMFAKIIEPATEEEIMKANPNQIKFKEDDNITDPQNIIVLDMEIQGEDFVATIQYKNNTYNAYAKINDKKCYLVKPTESLDDLEKYLFGENGKGRCLISIEVKEKIDLSDAIISGELIGTNGVFKKDPEDSNSTVHEKIKYSHLSDSGFDFETNPNLYMSIRYGRKVYSIKVSCKIEGQKLELMTVKEGTLSGYMPEGNLGKYVNYKGNTWIVLREDASGVELISANTLNNVTLGYGETELLSKHYEKARDSYNNAIETLIQECKNATGLNVEGDILSIRNVGGPIEEQTEQYTGPENSFKIQDTNYLSDYNQMENVGILTSDNMGAYWLSSREEMIDAISIRYGVRAVDSFSGLSVSSFFLWYRTDGGFGEGKTKTFGIRPVIKLRAGILDSVIGEGTSQKPITLK